jgi:hypothetical protein
VSVRAFIPAVLLLAVASTAAAQAPSVPVGARVRLLAIGGYRASGTAARVTPDSITVGEQVSGDLTLPWQALRRLEVLRVRTSTFTASRRGLLLGTAAGVLISAGAAIGGGGSISVKTSVPVIGISAGLGTILGAALLRKNAWEIVTIPSSPRP